MLLEKPRGGFFKVISLAGGAAAAAAAGVSSATLTAVTAAAATVAPAGTEGMLATVAVAFPVLTFRLTGLPLLALLLQNTGSARSLLLEGCTGRLQKPRRLLCDSCILLQHNLLLLKPPIIFT
jgi:hypothetical protein